MALLDSKQLNPNLTGSFILSGSTQTFIGRSDFQGSITASGDISASGTVFADKIQSTGGDSDGISFTDDLNLSGNLTASGDISSSGDLFVTGNSDLDGYLTVAKAITGSSHISASGDLFITGNSDIDGYLTVAKAITGSSHISASGNLSVTGTVDIDGNVDIDNTTTSIDSSGGISLDAGAASNLTTTDGTITIDGKTGVTIKEDGTNVIAIDTNRDVLFSQTGGSTSDPDVEFDGYTRFDGTTEITDTTNATSVSTGALIVDGGVGVAKDLVVGGILLASEVHTEFVSASVTTATGSNIFGDNITDSHQFTGSIEQSGSFNLNDGDLTVQDNFVLVGHLTASGNISASGNLSVTGDLDLDGTADFASHITASGNISASGIVTAEGLVISDDAEITDALTVGGHLDISDTIYHTGDSNTKIRFPEVDTISFHTSGDERLKITSTGAISGSAVSTGSFGQLIIGNGGDIDLDEDQRIYFESDKGTWIEADSTDRFRVVVGGSQMMVWDQDDERVVFGNGVNVFIGSNNNAQPSNELEVDGTISGSGILSIDGTANFGSHITASGNISASGNLSVTGDLDLDGTADFASHITASGNISGSSATTASFGYLNLDGDAVIGGNLTLGDSAGDSISFGAEISSSLIPDADSTYDIGSSSKNWRFGYIEQLSGTHVTGSGTGSFANVNVTEMSVSSVSELSSSIATTLNSLSADIIALSIALG